MTERPRDHLLSPDERGLATQDPADLARRTQRSWECLADLAQAADLGAETRSGRTGKDLLTGLGRWPDSRWVAEALAEARRGDRPGRTDQDADEDRLRAEHRRASGASVIKALRTAGTEAGAFFGSEDDEAYGLRPVSSPLGPLPLRTYLHATAYRNAVAALDLAATPGTKALRAEVLELGLVALVDVVGGLAGREKLTARLTADTDLGVWTFVAGKGAWRVDDADVRPAGPAVIAHADVLLDVTSGRASDVGGLYRRGEIKLEDVPGMLRLAPLLDQVPGIPGAAGLKIVARSLDLASRTFGALGKLRRPFS